MSEEKQKPTFREYQFDDLKNAFVRQNLMLKDRKNDIEAKLLTEKDVIERCSVKDSKELGELLKSAFDRVSSCNGIVEALAKAMYYDSSSWTNCVKNYWFTQDQMIIYGRKAAYRLRAIREEHQEKDAAEAVNASFYDMEAKESADGYILEFINKDGEKEQAKMPRRLYPIANIVDRTAVLPSKNSSEDDLNFKNRNAVSFRIRTECSEIIELAASATDQSKTEFIEDLIINFSHLAVRSKCSGYENTGKEVSLSIAENIYGILNNRYHNSEIKAPFPFYDSGEQQLEGMLMSGLGWRPNQEFTPGTFTSRENAIEQMTTWLDNSAKVIKKRATDQISLTNTLRKISRVGEEGFTEMMSDLRAEIEEAEGIIGVKSDKEDTSKTKKSSPKATKTPSSAQK